MLPVKGGEGCTHVESSDVHDEGGDWNKSTEAPKHLCERQTTSKVFKGVEKGEGCTHVESLHAFRERTSKGNLERMLPVKGGEGCTRLVNLERMPRTL